MLSSGILKFKMAFGFRKTATAVKEPDKLIDRLTAIELSPGGSSPYTSTDKTNKNKYT